MVKFSRLEVSIGVVGTLVAFCVTYYFSYTSGESNQRALLIDTLSKYRSFYEEVNANSAIACDSEGKLRGLYDSQYNSMLPVIKEDIEAPYDNPCPTRAVLSPPTNITVDFSGGWETWDDFMNDPEPSMSLQFPEGILLYPIDDEWKNAIIGWRTQLVEAKEKAAKLCAGKEDCNVEIKAAPQQ